ALVGASGRTGTLGAYLLDNLLAGGFKGPIYPVNPRYTELGGRTCYARLADLPQAPDLVVVVTPPRTLPDLIDASAERGARAVLAITPGFSESEAGRQLREEAMARARALGVRLIGPHCLGIMRPDIGLNATYARTPARPGSVALISQSGAVVSALLDFAQTAGFGFSSVISTGAASDVEFFEILDFLSTDGATRSIILYVEGVHDARAFMSSVRAAASVKPVVVLKVGRHLRGARAAMSHTGALVGDDAVFDAALRRAGAIRVGSYFDMLSAAEVLAAGRFPRPDPGNRLAIVSNGAGPGMLAADSAEQNEVVLANLTAETVAKLDQILPATWSHGNPIDVIRDADIDRCAMALERVLADPGNDGVLVLFSPTIAVGAEEAANALLPVAQASDKPVITAWLGGADARRGQAIFDAAGMATARSPERGVEAFGYISKFVRNRQMRLQVPPPQVAQFATEAAEARRIIERASGAGQAALDERASKALLAAFGIETARTRLAASAEEAVALADELGYPVALKVSATGVLHKTDVGGVILSVMNAREVAHGFELIRSRCAERAPAARFNGVLVQQMIVRPNGRELLIGLARDPTFGPVISFGMGGIAVEVLRDAAVALPPLNRFLARELISRTRVAQMLANFRGRPAVDIEVLIDVLLKVSDIACELPCVQELDINPLLVDENGAVALDARVVLGDGPLAPDATYSHLAIHPYPKALARTHRLRGEETVLLRPIRPEDAQAEKRFVSRLSPETMYLRFHAPLRELTTERLVRFTQIDYDREIAFVAIDGSGAQEEIRGVARYTRMPDGFSCEFGIVIEDGWQGRGLGHALMTALEETARSRGLTEIIGYVLRDNESMGRLMRGRGYIARSAPDDEGVRRFTKRLLGGAAASAARAFRGHAVERV
ncbi:MAG: bifunctional acetate--CoA ligase family protein/GNAT family N-acetyltransferase, partial [Burkholderiaceae bacterium]|nr:bifunctional acetate--CoA ligase family protein/GNAT family N-acetyltransferase [Burkholderiaceae bacterium]